MFRRKDDYDEYIAPVEEYRDEGIEKIEDCECSSRHGNTYREREYRDDCDTQKHTHGQTYKNYDYRGNCDTKHDHGQTYEDYNSEQNYYDQQSSLKDSFAAVLRPGEQILWTGSTVKDATAKERGVISPGLIVLVCVLLMPFCFFGFFFVAVLAIMLFTGVPEYAL